VPDVPASKVSVELAFTPPRSMAFAPIAFDPIWIPWAVAPLPIWMAVAVDPPSKVSVLLAAEAPPAALAPIVTDCVAFPDVVAICMVEAVATLPTVPMLIVPLAPDCMAIPAVPVMLPMFTKLPEESMRCVPAEAPVLIPVVPFMVVPVMVFPVEIVPKPEAIEPAVRAPTCVILE